MQSLANKNSYNHTHTALLYTIHNTILYMQYSAIQYESIALSELSALLSGTVWKHAEMVGRTSVSFLNAVVHPGMMWSPELSEILDFRKPDVGMRNTHTPRHTQFKVTLCSYRTEFIMQLQGQAPTICHTGHCHCQTMQGATHECRHEHTTDHTWRLVQARSHS